MFELTSRGYYHAHGRADDTMNLGGIKVHISLSENMMHKDNGMKCCYEHGYKAILLTYYRVHPISD